MTLPRLKSPADSRLSPTFPGGHKPHDHRRRTHGHTCESLPHSTVPAVSTPTGRRQTLPPGNGCANKHTKFLFYIFPSPAAKTERIKERLFCAEYKGGEHWLQAWNPGLPLWASVILGKLLSCSEPQFPLL